MGISTFLVSSFDKVIPSETKLSKPKTRKKRADEKQGSFLDLLVTEPSDPAKIARLEEINATSTSCTALFEHAETFTDARIVDKAQVDEAMTKATETLDAFFHDAGIAVTQQMDIFFDLQGNVLVAGHLEKSKIELLLHARPDITALLQEALLLTSDRVNMQKSGIFTKAYDEAYISKGPSEAMLMYKRYMALVEPVPHFNYTPTLLVIHYDGKTSDAYLEEMALYLV